MIMEMTENLRMNRNSVWLHAAVILVAQFISPVVSVIGEGESAATESRPFWFQPKETFPIEWGITNLEHGDFDGDGRMDLLVVENNRAKIHILWNRDPDAPVQLATGFGSTAINELPPDARFKMDAITSERRIIDLETGDLNNDGMPDIAYFGQPDGLVVHFNKGNRKWETPLEIPAEAGQINMNSLDIGDLNNDGLEDLILLAEDAAYVFHQQPGNKLGEAEKIALSSGVRGLLVQDLNNDGLNDLALLAWESETPIRIRWQTDGVLGPEIHYRLPAIGAYDIRDLNHDGIPEIICIESRSNDVCIYQLNEEPLPEIISGLGQGQIKLLAVDIDGAIGDAFLWADLNGDQRDDLILPDPQSGQLIYMEQDSSGRLDDLRKYPSLSGIESIAVGDWNNDDSPELFLLSPDEKTVGQTGLDELGKIPFPVPVPVKGLPLAMSFGHFHDREYSGLAVIAEDPDSAARSLQLFVDGEQVHSQILDTDYRGTPSSIHITDADHDGFADIVLLTPYQDLKILRGTASDFDEINVPPPGGTTESGMLRVIDFNSDGSEEMVFAIRNYIRITSLVNSGSAEEPKWNFQVIEQVNGSSGTSVIRAPIYFPGDGEVPETLGLLDTSQSTVSFCRRDESGTWKIARNYRLDIEQISAMQKIHAGASPTGTIALSGSNFVAWLAREEKAFQLSRISQYQTRINRGKLYDLITGDLNNDRQPDLIFIEADLNHIEIAKVTPELDFEPAVYWKVFEKQSFRSGPGASGEPREFTVADFNQDGRDDLAVLVHDRIILYPQD